MEDELEIIVTKRGKHMKIAEGLIERKEIVKKINRLNEEITANLYTEEDAIPNGNFIQSRMDTIIELSTQLSELNLKISNANAANLSLELNDLKTLDSLISFHQKWRKSLLSSGVEFMYGSRSEKTYTKNFDIDIMNSLLEDLEAKRRVIDKLLQRRNWEIEI